MSIKPVFGVDADEVLFVCEQKALDRVNEKYATNFTIDDISCYGITGNILLDKKQDEYSDPEFVKTQPLYPGAQEFITELRKRCDVVFITAVPPTCCNERAKALIEKFNARPQDIILTSHKDLFTGKFLLDDCPENIRLSQCEYPILFRRPWNKDVSGCMSVTKYEDVLCFVDFILGKQQEIEVKDNSIVCLVGPSGSGKTEKAKALIDKGFNVIETYKGVEGSGDKFIGKKIFLKLEKENFFAETTVYGGIKYGISHQDITKIKYNDKYVVIVDICGAMALRSIFGNRIIIAFCDVDKASAIENIIMRNIDNKEKVIRINGLDAELGIRKFCDISVQTLENLI